MGDRCYLEVTMLESDAEAFQQEVIKMYPSWSLDIWDESWVEDGVFTGVMYEANYGFYEELAKLAKQGFEFHGTQGAGVEYDASEFVTVDKKVVYVMIDTYHNIVVPVDLKTMKPHPVSIVTVRLFCQGMSDITDKFNNLMEGGNEG